jgi:hypothetical protein
VWAKAGDRCVWLRDLRRAQLAGSAPAACYTASVLAGRVADMVRWTRPAPATHLPVLLLPLPLLLLLLLLHKRRCHALSAAC